MIKGNELDLENTDFEIQALMTYRKFLCFNFFLKLKELFRSLQPDVQLRWDLEQNIAYTNFLF